MAGKKRTAPTELDWSEVERVLKLMAKHGLEEFEYSDGPLHIRLKKGHPNQAATSGGTTAAAAGPGEHAAPLAAPVPATVSAEASAQPVDEKLHIVKSPIVGTFYAAANPGAPPFVQVGDRVAIGQVLCIIEAMKLMNEIESDLAGEIVSILVENGQPVEYGEPLFAIRPAGPARTA